MKKWCKTWKSTRILFKSGTCVFCNGMLSFEIVTMFDLSQWSWIFFIFYFRPWIFKFCSKAFFSCFPCHSSSQHLSGFINVVHVTVSLYLFIKIIIIITNSESEAFNWLSLVKTGVLQSAQFWNGKLRLIKSLNIR